MILYQTSELGYFVCEIEALPSPEEEGVFLIPGGCVTVPPIETDEFHRPKYNWDTETWEAEEIPQPEEPEEDGE